MSNDPLAEPRVWVARRRYSYVQAYHPDPACIVMLRARKPYRRSTQRAAEARGLHPCKVCRGAP